MKSIRKINSLLVMAAAVAIVSAFCSVLEATPFTFIISDRINDDQQTLSTPRDRRDSVFFAGRYYDQAAGQDVTIDAYGQYFTSAPLEIHEGYTSPSTTSLIDASGNAGGFAATARNYAQSTNDHAFANGGAQVYNWYVLSGAGGPVSLHADIVFQARLYAQPDGIGGGAGAFFTQSLNFVSAPDDLTLDRVLVLNGTVIDPAQQPWAFGVQGTVDDVYFANDGTVHELNYIVRSNPFVVTPGVPFRLNLNVGGAADSFGVGTSEAYADFFDPEFATSALFPDLSDQLSPNGFVVNLGTNPDGSTRFGQLSDLGYAIQSAAIPEPSCALLIATGLGAFGLAVRRRRRPG